MKAQTVPELEARLAAVGQGPEHSATRVDALAELAWALRGVEVERSYRLASQARELAIAIGHKRGQARAARVLSMTAVSATSLREVLVHAEEAKALFDEVGDRAGSAGARDFLATLFEAIGDLSTGMELALEALELAREIDDPVRQGYALSSVGGILAANGDVDGAFARLHEALALFERAEDDAGIQRICSRLGRLCCDTVRVDEGRAHARRLLELAERRHDAFDRASALALLGELEAIDGESAEAERLFRQSIDAYEGDEPRAAMAVAAQTGLARLLVQRGALAEAHAHLSQALARLRRFDLLGSEEANVRGALADVCEQEGDSAQAVAHLRALIEINERRAQAETRNKLEQLEVRAEMKAAKQEAEIHRLRYVELSQMQAKLVESEKMAQLGRIAAGTAHELNTPLGVLRSNLSVYAKVAAVLAEPTSAEHVAGAERLRSALDASRRTSDEAIARIAAVADNFLRFTQLDLADKRRFDVIEGLQSALSLLGPSLRDGIRLERRFEPVPPIEGWPAALNQAFMTVLLNATEAIDGVGVISLETLATPGAVRVRIRDSGRGMHVEQRARLFDVGWSDQGARTKMRLGLLAAYATVQRHSGRLEVESAQGEGTTFTFTLPAAPVID